MECESCCWPEQDAVLEWWNEHSHELKEKVSEYRIKLQANIQTCLKCNANYFAQSHEYPCPYCELKKKMDKIDEAYKALYGASYEGMQEYSCKAITKATDILNEALEGKYSCEGESDKPDTDVPLLKPQYLTEGYDPKLLPKESYNE